MPLIQQIQMIEGEENQSNSLKISIKDEVNLKLIMQILT